MSNPVFIVEAFVYGHNQIRLEFDILMPINPPNLATDGNVDALDFWAKTAFTRMIADLKYSYPMSCGFCGKAARESYVNWASHAHLPPKGEPGWMGKPSPGPMATAYLHALCHVDSRCGQAAKGWSKAVNRMAGAPPHNVLDIPDDGTVYPRYGACAGCQTDASVGKTKSKCSICKTTLYCSQECQQNDWARHKKVCKRIKGTRFVNSVGTFETLLHNTTPLLPNQ